MENRTTLATEMLNDAAAKIIRMDDRIDIILPDAKRIQAVLKAVVYASIEGGISGEAIEYALDAVQMMVDVLCDNIEETSGLSKMFVQEVGG